MINTHLMEPFATAYRSPALETASHTVVDEIVSSRRLSYRVGATLVTIGSRLMHGDGAQPGHPRQAA